MNINAPEWDFRGITQSPRQITWYCLRI